MRTEACRTAFEITIESSLECCDRRRLSLVRHAGRRKPQLLCPLGKARCKQGNYFGARLDQLAAEARGLFRPWSDRVTRRVARRYASQRCITLRDRSRVHHRKSRARGCQPAEHAIEIGTANGRAAFDDRKSIRGEHERRNLGAQLLRRAQRCTVQFCPLSFTELDRHFQLDVRASARTTQCDSACLLAEPDELRIGARSRGEALRANV